MTVTPTRRASPENRTRILRLEGGCAVQLRQRRRNWVYHVTWFYAYDPYMIASSLYAGICSREVCVLLAELLKTSPRPLTPLLEDLTGEEVTVRVLASGERRLTGQEQARLNAEGLVTCRWRDAVLYLSLIHI